MRLLNIETLKLEFFSDWNTTPPYAILSHTWEDEEVLFDDLQPHPYDQEIQELQRRLRDLQHRVAVHMTPAGGDQRYWCRVENEEQVGGGVALEGAHLRRAKQKKGWSKIEGCCREAAGLGLSHVWIDTCCIDKSSSSELSESINSMFAWYRDSKVCFAYLSDIGPIRFECSEMTDSYRSKRYQMTESRWFKRGWTLQELIAPEDLFFYTENWDFIASRSSLAESIAARTGIPANILVHEDMEIVSNYSVAARLSWAATRETTRGEDRAYSLMGLFGVNMPTLYGEGEEAAFFRLQTEIFKETADHSIFAWHDGFIDTNNGYVVGPGEWPMPPVDQDAWVVLHKIPGDTSSERYIRVRASPGHEDVDLFAPSPESFRNAGNICRVPYSRTYDLTGLNFNSPIRFNTLSKYSQHAHGVRIQLLLEFNESRRAGCSVFLAYLGCEIQDSSQAVAIFLVSEEPGQYRRLSKKLVTIKQDDIVTSALTLEEVFLCSNRIGLAGRRLQAPRRVFITPRQFQAPPLIPMMPRLPGPGPIMPLHPGPIMPLRPGPGPRPSTPCGFSLRFAELGRCGFWLRGVTGTQDTSDPMEPRTRPSDWVHSDGSLEITQLGRAIHFLEFRNPSTEEAFVVIISHFLDDGLESVAVMVSEDIPVLDGRDGLREGLFRQGGIIVGGDPEVRWPNILTKALRGGKLHVIANFSHDLDCDSLDIVQVRMWIVVRREMEGVAWTERAWGNGGGSG